MFHFEFHRNLFICEIIRHISNVTLPFKMVHFSNGLLPCLEVVSVKDAIADHTFRCMNV